MKNSGSFNNALPVISLYAFAGYRLMPALQQIYGSLSKFDFIIPSVKKIHDDFINLKILNTNHDQEKIILKNKINLDYNEALKAKDKSKISTYRLILSAIKDLDISNRSGPNKKDTDDEDIKKLLKKMIKQRAESIDVYKKNNREDLLKVEETEHKILSSYLLTILLARECPSIHLSLFIVSRATITERE